MRDPLDAVKKTEKFQLQNRLWENYVEHGQGADELFASFLVDDASCTISVPVFQEFLVQNGHFGMGQIEFAELQGKTEFGLQDFRSWIRHATHDWSVHV